MLINSKSKRWHQITPYANDKFLPIFCYLISALPIFSYFYKFSRSAVNRPFYDDYNTALGFLVDYVNAETPGKAFALLFVPNNEHIVFVQKLSCLIIFSLFGKIDFVATALVGNLMLLGAFILLVQLMKPFGRKLQSAITLLWSVILFDCLGVENMIHTSAGIPNIRAFFFFILAIYGYHKKQKAWIVLGVVAQALSAMSMGAGLIAGIALVMYNILRKERLKIWLSVLMVCLSAVAYFLLVKGVSQPAESMSLLKMVKFGLHTTVARFSFVYWYVPFAALCLVLFTVRNTIRNGMHDETIQILLIIALFACMCIASAAVNRWNLGMQFAISSRYVIYSNLVAATAGSLLMIWFYRKYRSKYHFSILVTAIICMLSFQFMKNATKSGDYSGWYRQITLRTPPIHANPQWALAVLNKSCYSGIYCLPR
jgi:hypothetical protein